MLPAWHSPCVPSAEQVKSGCWSGVQPPSTHLRPESQVPPAPHGATQCSCTQTLPFVHCEELVQVVVWPVHTFFVVSQA